MAKLSFKKGTAAYAERRHRAEGIAREHPGIAKSRKFAIATASVKKSRARRERKV